MRYINGYDSPLGKLLLASDGSGLTGLWFEGQKYFGDGLENDAVERNLEVFDQTRRWLDEYFDGREPKFTPTLNIIGTEFQRRVYAKLLSIPRGTVVTYGELARSMGIKSARAIGGAVGRNRISIIIPCHRVIGADNRLIGYSAGVDKKLRLLEIEGVHI